MLHNLNIVHKKFNSEDRIKYYHIAQQLKTLKTSDAAKIKYLCEQYKELLKSPATKQDGLILILNLVKECAGQLFRAEAAAWMQAGLEVLQKEGALLQLSTTALAVVAAVGRRSRHHPELGRDLAPLVARLLPILLRDDLPQLPALKALRSLMEVFPSICLNHKPALEQHLLTILGTYHNNSAENIIEELGEAFCQLPFCSRASTDLSAQYKLLVDQLLMTLQVTLKQLLDEEPDMDHLLLPVEPLALPPLPPDAAYRVLDRFCGLAFCLATMIRAVPPQLSLPLDGVVGLSSKLLQVSEAQELLEAQYQVVGLLEAVVTTTHNGVVPWLSDLLTDLLQVLGQAAEEGHCTEFRLRIYSLLWALGPYLAPFSAQLLPHLLADVAELPLTEEPSRPAPRKRLRMGTELKASSSSLVTPGSGNPDTAVSDRQLVCSKALMVLDHLAASRGVPNKLKERLAEVAIQQALHPGQVYADPGCKLQLYTLLDSLSFGCRRSNPLLAKTIFSLLQNGSSDTDLKVAFLCKKATARTHVVRTSAPPSVKIPLPQDMQKYSAEVALADSEEEFAVNEEEEEDEMEEVMEEEEDEVLEEEMAYIRRSPDGAKMVNDRLAKPSSKPEANDKISAAATAAAAATYKPFSNRPKNGSCEEGPIQLDSSMEQDEDEVMSEEEEIEDEEEEEIVEDDMVTEDLTTNPPSDQILPDISQLKDEEEEEEAKAAALKEEEEWAVRNLEESEVTTVEIAVEKPAEILGDDCTYEVMGAEEEVQASPETTTITITTTEPTITNVCAAVSTEELCQPDSTDGNNGKAVAEDEETDSPDSPPVEKVAAPLQSNGTEEGVNSKEEEEPPSKKPRLEVEMAYEEELYEEEEEENLSDGLDEMNSTLDQVTNPTPTEIPSGPKILQITKIISEVD